MLDLRALTDQVAVAPQVAPEDMPAIREAGYVAVVNNRPDHEEAGQPTGEELRAAAQAAGLAYAEIPVTHEGIGQAEVDAMAALLGAADGPVVAFCRSGTRSCNLWALARAKAGEEPDALVEAGAGAGYDLSRLRPSLVGLSRRP